MAEQWSGNEVCTLKQAGIDCEFRQQGGAETVVDHLHQCWKARRFEALGETPVRKTADRKRLVTQAVTVLQQQQGRSVMSVPSIIGQIIRSSRRRGRRHGLS